MPFVVKNSLKSVKSSQNKKIHPNYIKCNEKFIKEKLNHILSPAMKEYLKLRKNIIQEEQRFK
jgi:hypothetical protein